MGIGADRFKVELARGVPRAGIRAQTIRMQVLRVRLAAAGHVVPKQLVLAKTQR